MPSRLGFTATALAVYSDTDHEEGPKGCLSYETTETDTTGISAEVTLSIPTVTVELGADRLVVARAYYGRVSSTVAGDIANFRIKRGGVQIQESRIDCGDTPTPANGGIFGYVESQPLALSAGSYSFTVTGSRADGTGTIAFRASSAAPAWLRVDDIGPAF